MKLGERLARLADRAIKDPVRADIGLYASNGAYYLFLSLVPLTALLFSLLPYTSLGEQQLIDALLAYTPDSFRQLEYAVVADVYAASPAALSLSAAAELWSAARFLASVVRGVGAISDGQTRGALRRRLMGALYTAALIVFILGNLMLLLFGRRLLGIVHERWPGTEGLWAVILRLRAVLFFAGLTAANTLLFRYAPKRSLRLRDQLPGAALAAAGWMAFSRLYSWALERFGLFGLYGRLAAFVISLFWMYCSLYILFFGAWFNALLEREDR